MSAPVFAQLAPALESFRLSLHVLAASVWVGGQFTVAGLVPTARRLGEDAPRQVARAFSRLSWPAFWVLILTGIWNSAAVHGGQPKSWQAVLGVKIVVALAAGGAAYLHSHAKNRKQIALWGGIAGITSLVALVLGVLLAG